MLRIRFVNAKPVLEQGRVGAQSCESHARLTYWFYDRDVDLLALLPVAGNYGIDIEFCTERQLGANPVGCSVELCGEEAAGKGICRELTVSPRPKRSRPSPTSETSRAGEPVAASGWPVLTAALGTVVLPRIVTCVVDGSVVVGPGTVVVPPTITPL